MFKFFAKKRKILSPCSGEFIKQENIRDEMFKKGILGTSFAIKPTENYIYSPISGLIKMIYPTKHALGIEVESGVEVLIHVGIDTVKLKGEGFEVLVKEGQKIEAGDLIMKVDFDLIKSKNYFEEVICVLINFKKITFNSLDTLKAKEEVLVFE